MMAYSRDRKAARLLEKMRALFNLNDPGWGRGTGDKPGAEPERDPSRPEDASQQPPPIRPAPSDQPPESRPNGSPQRPTRPAGGGRNSNDPPDLDELWQDLNGKLGRLLGQGERPRQPSGGGNQGGGGGRGFPGGIRPPALSGGLFVAGVAVAVLLWLASGIFIVQEGYQAVVTRFGQFERTVNAGVNYRWPTPIGRHESVQVSQIQSADIGNDRTIKETGLNHYAMLTEDENIVEVRFAVQYRLNDARAWLFETQDPRLAVITAAESAVREVVGKMRMDNVLAGERDQIAPRVRELMQAILDRYSVGVEVVAINMQQSGVRPPEQVRDAFDDVLRADQERERAKNEAEAYANNVIPRAVGEASRVQEEAQAYRERIIAESRGDAERFVAVLQEYQKAPRVTRERLYLETMEEVYRNSSKVVVDTSGRNGSSLMYLPLDKLVEQSVSKSAERNQASSSSTGNTPAAAPSGGTATPAGNSPSFGQTGSVRPGRDAR